ncbi:MAG: hypothetical protein J6S87_04960, partial [Bacteroidales bacterium]|nr:hypothetical protein [Bacteroidales bacterium]
MPARVRAAHSSTGTSSRCSSSRRAADSGCSSALLWTMAKGTENSRKRVRAARSGSPNVLCEIT